MVYGKAFHLSQSVPCLGALSPGSGHSRCQRRMPLTVLDKNCFVKSPGRYSLVPLPQGMVILRGSLNFLSRAGSFLAFLILSLCYFIFFGFPKSVVFRTKLLKIKINIFHGSSYACMAEQHLEFLHIKTLTHVVASKWRRLWG